MMLLKVAFLLFVNVALVKSWYTCDDKEFCKNIRNKVGKHHFEINQTSITWTKYNVQADLINNNTKQVLKLNITGLAHDTFRFTINDPQKPRHNVSEALDGIPRVSEINVTKTNTNILIKNGNVNATINLKPFKINVFSKILNVTLNEDGKMEFMSNKTDEAIAMDIKFPGAQRAYGIPEHSERLSLKSTKVGGRNPYRLFNIDYPGYENETPDPLYGAVPVLYAHGTNHTAGVFWLNSAQTFVDINTENKSVNSFFISESGMMDIFVLSGPTLKDSVQQYSALTGTAPLPQLFTLGYHQSRWSYMNQTDLETVVTQLDKNNYPLDVMWLDIDYTSGKKYFTWNYTAFPNPMGMQNKLQSMGRKLVVIIDPHIKAEPGYFVYDQALKNDYFVKNPNGSVYKGECWPGMSSYIDFKNPKALNWYAELYSYKNFSNTSSIVHIWNDMNEPSVFEVDEKTMANNLTHYGGWTHRDVHNIYGFLQTKGTFEGMQARFNKTQRPFILTRSHFAGSQRYTAMWTGDNVASWDHLQISIPMCLTEALAGISFCGADVGGFIGNPDNELLQRWYQLGSWLPFYRAHSAADTNRREPYLYSQEVQKRFLKAIRDRYAHLPHWYTIWFEHERFGSPVIRPLTYHYAKDANVLDIDMQFMVGSDIMVAPVVKQGAKNVQIYLPGGAAEGWFTLDNIKYPGMGWRTFDVSLDSLPVFYRAGSIIPRKDVQRNSTAAMKKDPYSLYVFLNQSEGAIGRLYVDDNESYNYTKGAYHYVELIFTNNSFKTRKIDESAHFEQKIEIDTIYIFAKSKKEFKMGELTVDGLTKIVPVRYDENNGYLFVSNLKLNMLSEFTLNLVS